jgi:DNA-binding response OmpR family regulator
MRLFLNARILCVDDDQDSCEIIKLILSFADPNYQVTTVSGAEEALSLLKSETFDLYILDYSLPQISGIELCREIRRIDPDAPIMFFSANAFEKDKNTAIDAGASAYLVKPEGLDKLTGTVEKLLNHESPYLF